MTPPASVVLACPACGGTYTVREVLRQPHAYWAALDVLQCTTPCCGRTEEVQLRDGEIIRGYVYAAGAPHFAGMECHGIPELRVRSRRGGLVYEVGREVFVAEGVSPT
ncbi:MAG: hypothetical protein AAF791_06050 [Bacteroidota bacterium]